MGKFKYTTSRTRELFEKFFSDADSQLKYMLYRHEELQRELKEVKEERMKEYDSTIVLHRKLQKAKEKIAKITHEKYLLKKRIKKLKTK